MATCSHKVVHELMQEKKKKNPYKSEIYDDAVGDKLMRRVSQVEFFVYDLLY